MNPRPDPTHSPRYAWLRSRNPAHRPPAPPRLLAGAASLALLLLLSCSVQNNGPAAAPATGGKDGGPAAARPPLAETPREPPTETLAQPAAGAEPAAGGAAVAKPEPAKAEGEQAPSPTQPPPAIQELAVKLQAGAPGEPNPTAGGVAAGPEEEKELLAELESAIKGWIVDLDADKDLETLARMSISKADLENTIAPGHRTILLGTLLAKNEEVLKTLAEAARGTEVKLLRWSPGKVIRTGSGTGLFLKSVPLISSNILELELGKFPVELELRQAMKLDGTWKVMEYLVKH